MKHRRPISLLFLTITAMFVVPAAAEAALTTEQAARALHTSGAGLAQRTSLSASKLDRFVTGSQAVGGLSERQLLIVLRDPSLIKTVGVTERRSGIDVRASARYPEHGCRRTGAYVTLDSIGGVRLWTFRVSKHWCWDKSERKVSVTRGSIEVDPDVPQTAAIAGWKYEGIDDGGKTDYYYQYQGSGSRGAHSAFRRGVFKYCPIRVGCFNTRRPKIRVGTRWTGSAFENHDVG